MPAKYVPVALQTQGLSPLQFREAIMPQIQVDNKVEECWVFINWMQVAVILTNVRVPRSQPPREVSMVGVIKLSLVLLMMDLVLHQQCKEITNRDLVMRYNVGDSMGAAILQLMQAVANQRVPVNLMPEVVD